MAEWQKVETTPVWNFEVEKELVGVYISKEENVGPNASNLYTFERENGTMIGVWGGTLLDDRFKNLMVGEEVKIMYLGKQKSEKTGREFNSFEVYRRPMEANKSGKKE